MNMQLRYQAGAPRNSVGAKSNVRLDRFQAPYTRPYIDRFVCLAGDTLEVDIATEGLPISFGTIWFYGWKLQVKGINDPSSIPQDARIVRLEDLRQL